MSEAIKDARSPRDRLAVLKNIKRKVHGAIESLDAGGAEYSARSKTLAERIVRDELLDLAGGRRNNLYGELLAYVNDDLFGLGPLEPLLRDASVTDILVENTQIYVVRGSARCKAVESFATLDDLRRVIDRITSRVGKRVDVMTPHCDCDLYEGSRCHIIVPPTADRHYVTIRKLGCMDLNLSDWVAKGIITAAGAKLLGDAVRDKKNIILAGGTGAGKTTLLNTLAKLVESDQIIITLEDTHELRIDKPHVRRLLTRAKSNENQEAVTFSRLIKDAMRMNPDRLIMGEVRDAAAYDLLHALNTGHRGSISTVHANSAVDALWRIETLATMAAQNCNLMTIRRQVSRVVDLIVYMRGIELEAGRYQARRILEISELECRLNKQGEYKLLCLYRGDDA